MGVLLRYRYDDMYWEKMGKLGQNREKLVGTRKNWEKLRQLVKNSEKFVKNWVKIVKNLLKIVRLGKNC